MLLDVLQSGASDALLQWRSREIWPTDLSSFDISGLSRELRMQSVLSARTTNAEYLGGVAEVIDDVLAGKINMADARWQLMRKLKQLGYDPEVGFPQDMADIPPAERGSLQDLSSDARLQLMLETNTRIAANYGLMVAGNTPYARYAYPAYELVRLYVRAVPRGSVESRTAGWDERWNDAGEAVDWEGALKNPKLALKDSPIWQALGDGAGGYQDALGNPFPPYAFGTGWGWKMRARQYCIDLGLLTGDEVPDEMEGELTPDEERVNEIFDGLPADLQEELRRELADDSARERLRRSEEEHRERQDAIQREQETRREEDLAAGRRAVEEWLA